MESKRFDVCIVGAGPAGLTAAIYASRAELSTVILEGNAPGGKLLKTAEIANWPGIVETEGVTLAMSMHEHALAFGSSYHAGAVEQIKQDTAGFTLVMQDGDIVQAQTIIWATGTQERTLDIPGRQEAEGRGVSYCAICDGAFYRDKVVAVVGGGNSAFDEGIYLTKFAKQVHILVRNEIRAEPIIVDKAKENPNIIIHMHTVVTEVLLQDKKMSGVRIQNTVTKVMEDLAVNGMFLYIGADPITKPLETLGITNERGYVVADDKMKTKIPGLFAAGDVVDKYLRQVVTAVNDGAIAAQAAAEYLEQNPVAYESN